MTAEAGDAPPLASQGVLQIDLDAIAANYRLLQDRLGNTLCAPAVKADAYGLGMEQVAPALYGAGARLFFVAHLTEGLALRRLLPDAEIACLNGVFAPDVHTVLQARLVPVLNDLDAIALWRAQGAGRPAFIHIDTGMNRLGLGPDAVQALIDAPALMDGLSVRGWMTHMACADTPDHPLNADQRGRFADAVAKLPPAPASLANSASVFLGNDYHFDIARPGCALYGVNPTPHAPNPMQPVVTVRCPVLQTRTITQPGTTGYGATAPVRPGSRTATIAVGYADGFMRHLSNVGHVMINDHRVPVIGRVSMDLVTVDVTALPANTIQPGVTQAEILGPDLTVDTQGAAAGTIGYEVLTALGSRYRRVHRSHGCA